MNEAEAALVNLATLAGNNALTIAKLGARAEALQEENQRLHAEVERLTPKPGDGDGE